MLRKNKVYVINILIIYLLILMPSIFTPFQSDDYFYYLKGISLNKTIIHYLGWSGRIVTDTMSSFLLSSLPYYLYEAINALIFLLMCIFISLLPMLILYKHYLKFSSLTLWLVFLVYWIANPNLGQTSFWIVGSTNYLWTIMWASVYIFYYFYLLSSCSIVRKNQYIYLFIFGFLAGCSNESTGVTVVVFSILMLFLEKIKNKIVYIGISSSFLGCLVLLVAPGNFIRAARHPDWYALSTFEQLQIHLTQRISNIFVIYDHAFLILLMLCILMLIIKAKVDKRIWKYSIVFLGLSFFANIILVKAPVVYARSLNTGLFFLLYPISILFYYLCNHIKVRWCTVMPIFYGLSLFIPSYLYFTFMMIQSKVQFEIREELIMQQKSDGVRDVIIPDWYFTPLLKNTDTFDRYRSETMPIYYGVNSITWMPAKFNYAALRVGNKYKKNLTIVNDLSLINIYSYVCDPLSINNRNSIILEFSGILREYISEENMDWRLVFYNIDGDELLNMKHDEIVEMQIRGKSYINVKSFDFLDIKKIAFVF